MAEYRRFFAEESCRDGQEIYISGNEFNHMKKVLRLRKGEQVIVCFNDGIDHLCVIDEMGDKEAKLVIEKSFENQAENKVSVTLFQACMKGDKMDFCVQKAVELGVDTIVPFENAFTIAKFDNKKTERFERIAFEASKQCGRAKLTTVKDCIKFSALLKELHNFDKVIFCNEYESENMMLDTLLDHTFSQNVAIIVGSEGGFANEEQQKIKEFDNVISVSFGKRILRAETAGVFALSILSSILNLKR